MGASAYPSSLFSGGGRTQEAVRYAAHKWRGGSQRALALNKGCRKDGPIAANKWGTKLYCLECLGFLKSLKAKITLEKINKVNCERSSQLIAKTNQFKLNSKLFSPKNLLFNFSATVARSSLITSLGQDPTRKRVFISGLLAIRSLTTRSNSS